jgi:hypothetical protein
MSRRSTLYDANLALDGKLIAWLRKWCSQGVSYPEMTDRVNDKRRVKANRVGAPEPDDYNPSTVWHWCRDELGIGNGR